MPRQRWGKAKKQRHTRLHVDEEAARDVLARGGGVEENAARFRRSAKLHATVAVRWRRVQAVAAEAVLAQRQRPGGIADARAGVAQVHGDEFAWHRTEQEQSNQAAL